MVNRPDAFYNYNQGIKVDRPVDDWLLERHVEGGVTIGLYTTSVDQKCRWGCWDFDNHDGKTFNFDAAKALVTELESRGFLPILEDSNGNQGFHVWIVFDEPVNSWDLYDWMQTIPVTASVERYPKQRKINRYGNLVRLPGKYHNGDHWSVFWEGEDQWSPNVDWELSDHRLIPIGQVPESYTYARGNRKASQLEIQPALSALTKIPKNRADDYWDWLKVGMILYDLDSSQEMLDRWIEWSKQSDKFKPGACEDKWASFEESRPNNPATVATLFSWIEEPTQAQPQPANVVELVKPEVGPQRFYPGDFYSLYDNSLKDHPPVHWIVNTILPEGLTILGGKPKCGKSWLVFNLCLSVSSGERALGKYGVERGTVFYLALEDTDRRINQRQMMCWKHKPIPKNLILTTSWPKLDQGTLLGLESFVDDHPDTKLIVVDTLGMVRPAQKNNTNVYDQDVAAIKPLRALSHERGISIVIVHHLNKMVSEDPFMTFSGTQGLSGTADNLWILRPGKGCDGELLVKGRDTENQSLAMNMVSGNWEVIGDADEYENKGLAQRVLQILKTTHSEMSVNEIHAELNFNTSKGYLQTVINNLRDAGKLEKVKHGYYRYKGNILNRLSSFEEIPVIGRAR